MVKSLARPFYQAHAGFFFLLFFIAGGFMRSNEHIAIATFIAQSDFLTLLLIFLFTLYHLKVWMFTRAILNADAYLFLRNITVTGYKRQVFVFIALYFTLSLIVLVYGIFVGAFMVYYQEFLKTSILLCYFLISSVIYSLLIVKQLNKPIFEYISGFLVRKINEKHYSPFVFWFIMHLIKNRPLMLILSKLLSLGLLIICFSAYDSIDYDWRFLGISIVVVSSANLVIIHSFVEFHVRDLVMMRGLPISALQRLLSYLFVSLFLLLPEITVIIRRLPLDAPLFYAWQASLFAISNFLFFVHYAIYTNTGIEKLGKACLFITMAQMYLILFGVPLYILGVVMIPIIFVVQKKYLVRHDY